MTSSARIQPRGLSDSIARLSRHSAIARAAACSRGFSRPSPLRRRQASVGLGLVKRAIFQLDGVLRQPIRAALRRECGREVRMKLQQVVHVVGRVGQLRRASAGGATSPCASAPCRSSGRAVAPRARRTRPAAGSRAWLPRPGCRRPGRARRVRQAAAPRGPGVRHAGSSVSTRSASSPCSASRSSPASGSTRKQSLSVATCTRQSCG